MLKSKENIMLIVKNIENIKRNMLKLTEKKNLSNQELEKIERLVYIIFLVM